MKAHGFSWTETGLLTVSEVNLLIELATEEVELQRSKDDHTKRQRSQPKGTVLAPVLD